jgi:hypothetical protein
MGCCLCTNKPPPLRCVRCLEYQELTARGAIYMYCHSNINLA